MKKVDKVVPNPFEGQLGVLGEDTLSVDSDSSSEPNDEILFSESSSDASDSSLDDKGHHQRIGSRKRPRPEGSTRRKSSRRTGGGRMDTSANGSPNTVTSFTDLENLLTKSQLYSQFIDEQVSEMLQSLPAEGSLTSEGAAGSSSQLTSSTPTRQVAPSLLSTLGDGEPRTIPATEVCHLLPRSKRLYPHQLEGIRWLSSLYANGVNGILADEMGLGKTIQVVAFLASLAEKAGIVGPHLIVVPLSTLSNWKKEIESWIPDTTLIVYHGTASQRRRFRQQIRTKRRRLEDYEKQLGALPGQGDAPSSRGASSSTVKPLSAKEVLKKFGVIVLTSYEMVLADRGILRLESRYRWNCLIVDEGHRLKNFECQLIKVLRQFYCECRILLTGTPLQNNLAELWSILNFILPDVFDELEKFERWFSAAALQQESSSDDESEGIEGVEDQESKAEIHENEIGQSTTASVPQAQSLADNPSAEVVVASTDSTPAKAENEAAPSLEAPSPSAQVNVDTSAAALSHQRLIHVVAKMHKVLRPFLLRRIKAEIPELKLPPKYEVVLRCPLFPEQGAQYERVRTSKAYSNGRLVHLRKVCCHPHLFEEFDPFHNEVRQRQIREKIGPAKYVAGLLGASSKLMLLHRMLTLLHQEGRRVLIFSQLTSVLDLVEDYIMYLGKWKYERIDGSRTSSQRMESLQNFQRDASDIFIFLLSTRAGGLGINLTNADTVILYDCDFNPHNDLQAIDRCHRIGQKNPVVVYRLVCPNTVEDIVYRISLRKIRMERLLIGEGRFHRRGSTTSGKPHPSPMPQQSSDVTQGSDLQGLEASIAEEEQRVLQEEKELSEAIARIKELRWGDIEADVSGAIATQGSNGIDKLSVPSAELGGDQIEENTLRWLVCDRQRLAEMCDMRRRGGSTPNGNVATPARAASTGFELL
jgi:ATP-dependent DNA helicase